VWRRWRARIELMTQRADMSSGAAPLLATRGLTKSFRNLIALKNHELTVQPGEIVGVIGPNGSGKSTFFNLVSGFLRADSGEVVFNGKPILGRSAAEIVRLGLARTFQGTRLFGGLSVADNIRAAAELRHRSTMLDGLVGTHRLGRAKAAVEETAQELLALVDLTERQGDRASDLPYGDQRRLELVRALATGPRLLMLDEPAAGMDAAETRALLKLIDQVRHRFGLAVIVVEHDMDLIMYLCERIQVLAHGIRIFEGSPAEVQANPRVREVYLGHA
jgi:branched-chain amino acid transport system ATP-binding protein